MKLKQTFLIFIIFRLVLWISSSSWLNVESGALLKVMLVFQRGLKEIYVLHFFKITRRKVQRYALGKTVRAASPCLKRVLNRYEGPCLFYE